MWAAGSPDSVDSDHLHCMSCGARDVLSRARLQFSYAPVVDHDEHTFFDRLIACLSIGVKGEQCTGLIKNSLVSVYL